MNTHLRFMRFFRTRIVLVIGLLLVAACLSGCSETFKFFFFNAQEADEEPSLPITIQATGKFESLANYNPQITCPESQNTITLRWEVFPDSGESRFLGGEGKRYFECDDLLFSKQDLVFEGSMSGDNFEGVVHVTGSYIWASEIEYMDYPASWKATRPPNGSNYIEGTVDGLGGFTLKVWGDSR